MLPLKYLGVFLIVSITLLYLVQFLSEKCPVSKGRSVPKVLILTQARSGSTFLLSLMTAGDNIAQFGEPLAKFQHQDSVAKVKSRVTGLLGCDAEGVKTWNERHSHIQVMNCGDSEGLVMKTIRLRYWQVESWIAQSDIKVIHLLRDPRAIISSRVAKDWKNTKENDPEHICRQMEDDMRLSNILPPDRYLMIKYEELVKDPASRLQMLYDFAGLRMTAKAYEFLYETTHGESSGSVLRPVVRDEDFNPNHWQTETPIEDIRTIESNCQSLMKLLNYPVFKQ